VDGDRLPRRTSELSGLERLGRLVDEEGRNRSLRSRRRPQPRSRWRTILLVGFALVVVAAGLAAGEYGYVEWKLSQIKSVQCHACRNTAPDAAFNVLIVGSDSRTGNSGAAARSFGSASQVGGQRSDTIKVVRVQPKSGTAKVLSIPRDTFVTLSGMPSGTGLSAKNKINTAFDAGIDPLVQTIQNTFGIPINHYVTIDFSGVINLVNSVGTVSLDFPYPVRDDDEGNNNSGLRITRPGCQSVDGATALALARSRFYQYYEDGSWHSDLSSDLGRIERQNIVMSAIVDKAKSDLNPIDLNRLLGAVVGDITKDQALSGNELVTLATHYHALSGSSLQSWTLPTTGASAGSYGAVEVVTPAEAQQVVRQFLGSAAPLPIATPPLDGDGIAQTTSPAPQASTTLPTSSSAGASGGAPVTTVPETSPASFDPTVC
jgi:LCP family protein required for cell wall assembly